MAQRSGLLFHGVDICISGRSMTPSLPLHLQELEHRAAILQLSLQGLRASWASNAVAQVDFDVVCHSAEKLRAHLQGVRIECEYAKGGK
jgi:hypothetical protein